MSDRIPVVTCIDAEPDPRNLDRQAAPPWRGFEALQPVFGAYRAALAARTGAPAHFSWFFRMDPQIAVTCGAAAWALRAYRPFVDEARARGDELGVHLHAYRWDAPRDAWISDCGNEPWVEQCVRTSLAAFEDALGSRCVSFRFGDRWMNDATVALLEELGVRFDLTMEPGTPPAPNLVAGEPSTGPLPDLAAVPRRPYRPSRRDFRRSDPERADGLWMVPVTTGRPRRSIRWARRVYCRLAGLHLLGDVMPLNLALRPLLFRSILDPALACPDARPIVAVLRTHSGAVARELARLHANVDYLLGHRLADRFVFVTPAEAALILGLG